MMFRKIISAFTAVTVVVSLLAAPLYAEDEEVVLFEGEKSCSNWGQAWETMTTKHGGGTFDLELLKPGITIHVTYTGEVPPELIIDSWSGGKQWVKIAPAEDNGSIAVYTYSDIIDAYESEDFSTLDKIVIGAGDSNLTVTKVVLREGSGEEPSTEEPSTEEPSDKDIVLFQGTASAEGDWAQVWDVTTVKNDGGTFDPDLLKSGSAIYVTYISDNPPELILQSWLGGEGWAKVAPAEDDGSTAVYTHADIVSAYKTNDFSTLDKIHVSAGGSILTVTKVVLREGSSEEPSTEESSTEEPTTEEPATEEPSTEEPSTEEPSTEEPSDKDFVLFEGKKSSKGDWDQVWDVTTVKNDGGTFDPDLLKSGIEIHVTYISDNPPELILQSWLGGEGWAKVAPAEDDGSTAVYTYADIVSAYKTKDFSTLDKIHVSAGGSILTVTKVVLKGSYSEQPTTEEPTTEEPTTEEPTTEEPATEEPVTEEPTTEEPSDKDIVLFEGKKSCPSWGQAWEEPTVKNDGKFNPELLKPGSAIYVTYQSNASPEIILQSWSGGEGWAKVAPAEDNGSTAVYTYADIVSAYKTNDFSTLDKIVIGAGDGDLTVTKVVLKASASGETPGGETPDDETELPAYYYPVTTLPSAVQPKSENVDSNGAVSKTAITEEATKAISEAKNNTVILSTKNAGIITTSVINELADLAKKSGKKVELRADSLAADGKKVMARLYIDPTAFSDVKDDIKLGITTDTNATVSTVNKFIKYFDNDVSVIKCEQQGSFGAEIKIAVKVDLNKFNTNNLIFYSYNKKSNSYKKIETSYKIDKNGYVHFTTKFAGDIIITDKPLSIKK